MTSYSSESMEERIARLLDVYAARACAPLKVEEARAGARAMAEGLAARGIVADELYDLFELAVLYKAVPDYRSCARVIASADWETVRNRRRATQKMAEKQQSEAATNVIARTKGSAMDEVIRKRMLGATTVEEKVSKEEVWQWWQTLESCAPSIRRGFYSNELCPYGKMRAVHDRLVECGYSPKWEQWETGTDGIIRCNGLEVDFCV